MAACCSSTCATITASRRWWPTRIRRPSRIAEKLRAEWVVKIDGKVRRRPGGTENADLPTGAVEVYITEIEVLGPAAELPMPVFGEQEYPEEIRLKYRFLDLRRERLHNNIMQRGQIIDSIRRRMKEQGFFEFQTPILTASSPEGARDLSRAVAHPSGQVLRAAAGAAAVQAAHHDRGLRPLLPDRAVLPRRGCARRPFARRVLSARRRDELRHAGRRVRRGRAGDARRVRGIRRRQAGDAEVSADPLCRSARKYGTDKPDLRNPIEMQDVSEIFRGSGFKVFARILETAAEDPGVGDPGAGRRLARLLRPHELVGARRGAAGPRLHLLRRGRGQDARPRPGRQQRRAGAHRATTHATRPEGRRRGLLRRGRSGTVS